MGDDRLLLTSPRIHHRRPIWNLKGMAATERVDEVEKHIEELEASKYELEMQLEDLDRLWRARKQQLLDQISDNMRKRLEASLQLEMLHHHGARELPGPAALWWVNTLTFNWLCTLVICLNILVMWIEASNDADRHPGLAIVFSHANDAFLAWYVSELTMKVLVYQHLFLCGDLLPVAWNMLDLLLVLFGVLEQWIVPAVDGVYGVNLDRTDDIPTTFPVLRLLRKLRLIRLLRLLRVIRHFCTLDLSWAEGVRFQTFVMICVGINSILLGVELDVPWSGWQALEHCLLAVYVVELSARLQHWGTSFFFSTADRKWNVMDFIIVVGGVLESWVVPLFFYSMQLLPGRQVIGHESAGSGLMDMLRICRLVRIMRLVRLIHSIPPLYILAMGILKAMQGMQWVIILTVAVLYACSILATSLVGHGIIYCGSAQPPEAEEIFGNVLESIFNLFKIMNNDQSVVEPLLNSGFVKAFFVCFMIIANWSMLAILTSVVSDNMISATMSDKRRTEEMRARMKVSFREPKLRALFRRADHDNSGTVDEVEFKNFLQDRASEKEFCEYTGLSPESLMDMFTCMSSEGPDQHRYIHYEDFINKLSVENKGATERTVFRIEERIRAHERRLTQQFQCVLRSIGVGPEESRSILRLGRAEDEVAAKRRLQCLTGLSL